MAYLTSSESSGTTSSSELEFLLTSSDENLSVELRKRNQNGKYPKKKWLNPEQQSQLLVRKDPVGLFPDHEKSTLAFKRERKLNRHYELDRDPNRGSVVSIHGKDPVNPTFENKWARTTRELQIPVIGDKRRGYAVKKKSKELRWRPDKELMGPPVEEPTSHSIYEDGYQNPTVHIPLRIEQIADASLRNTYVPIIAPRIHALEGGIVHVFDSRSLRTYRIFDKQEFDLIASLRFDEMLPEEQLTCLSFVRTRHSIALGFADGNAAICRVEMDNSTQIGRGRHNFEYVMAPAKANLVITKIEQHPCTPRFVALSYYDTTRMSYIVRVIDQDRLLDKDNNILTAGDKEKEFFSQYPDDEDEFGGCQGPFRTVDGKVSIPMKEPRQHVRILSIRIVERITDIMWFSDRRNLLMVFTEKTMRLLDISREEKKKVLKSATLAHPLTSPSTHPSLPSLFSALDRHRVLLFDRRCLKTPVSIVDVPGEALGRGTPSLAVWCPSDMNKLFIHFRASQRAAVIQYNTYPDCSQLTDGACKESEVDPILRRLPKSTEEVGVEEFRWPCNINDEYPITLIDHFIAEDDVDGGLMEAVPFPAEWKCVQCPLVLKPELEVNTISFTGSSTSIRRVQSDPDLTSINEEGIFVHPFKRYATIARDRRDRDEFLECVEWRVWDQMHSLIKRRSRRSRSEERSSCPTPRKYRYGEEEDLIRPFPITKTLPYLPHFEKNEVVYPVYTSDFVDVTTLETTLKMSRPLPKNVEYFHHRSPPKIPVRREKIDYENFNTTQPPGPVMPIIKVMTKVKLHKSLCLGLSGDLLVCEINEQFEPMVGAAQSVWSAAGDELNDFRQMVALPLQECSLQISPPFQLKQKFTKVAHVVVPSVANQTSLTIEERANLKNCYDTLFFKAKEMEMKKVILPFLGKVSANLSTADAVDIAFNAVFDAIQDGEMEAVTEVFFFTTITEVYEAAKAHILYKNRKNMDNRSTGGNTRKCSIGECTTLKPRESRCEGDLISLQSVIGTWKSDSRNSELLGCAHEADLIMCRIGEFAVNWSSVESSRYEICKRHLNMFLLDWKNPFWRNFRSRDGVTQCSFPEHQGPIPMLNRDRNKLVTKSDAERWKGKRNSILRVGIPLCEQDLAFLRGSQFDPVPCQADFDITDSVCDLADHFDRIPPLPKKTKSTADEEVKKAVKHLLDTLNSGSNFERRKDWVYLSDRQKREKVRTARTALNAVIEVLSPDAKDELRGRVLNGGIIRQNESCSPFKKLLTDVAELYERAESKIHRLFILSSVATVELPVLQQFFIGLTPYFHKKARTVRVKGSVDIPHRIIRVRYDEAKMDKLIEFILSPFVVINLPFDERLERMDDGTTMSMPNLMRLQTIDEVYRMYLAYLEEEGILDMALNETTAKFIIKLVAPTRRKNLTCVDEKLADGMTSFDELFSIVDELLKKGFIENDIASTLTKDLQLSKSYLRGDFKAHVKRHSECADHCASYALSDPHSPYLANDCSSGPHAHVHDSICQRCNDVDTTLKTVKELLENAENTAPTTAERSHFSILNEECELHCKAIYEMKNHQMRASLSHDEKAEFVQTLTPGHALITLDWAQKLTPFYAREKQVEYYAKAGIAYHISHALTVKDGEQAEHLSVHIFEPGEKQDGTAVYLIVKEFLLELKQMGINRVMVRSDCAGCYRNAPLICSLMNLQNETGVDIDGLLFCEAQAGKGPCDRGSALVKRHARDHVTTTRGKIETKEQFFNALVTGKLLNAVSVHLCSISDVKEVKSSILNITSYSSFEFEANGIRLRRHRSIGEGLLFDHTRLTPCEGRLEINRSGGHTVDTDDLFWFTKTSHRSREPAKSTTVSPVVSSGILCCPEENCSSEFRSFHMLQKHIFTDKHKYELERKTMHDLVTEMASRSFDTTLTSVSLTHAISSSVHSRPSDLKKGWALRETKKRNSLDKPARDLIRQFFAEKRDAKLKVNPHEAERFMKNARGNGGELLISPRNRLSITQIKSLIRGLLKNEDSSASAKKGKKNVTPVATNESSNESTDEEESDDEEAVRALILSHKNDLFLNDDSSADEDEPSKKRIRGRK